ncbi:reverse transcriptase domain-containing protein [Tanacetum coccineum]
MMELRRKLFKGTDDEDAHEHVRRVLEIADLFHFPSVTHDVVMLRVFPITLKGPALRWINILSSGLATTWDLFEKAFIRQYCPPLKTAKKLEEIYNFKQEVDEPLYRAWERYSDILYRCPQHDLNSQQRVHIFYTGLYIPSRIMLDSKEFIPLMTPTQALKSIQVMAYHSHNWYHEATTKEGIEGSLDDVDIKQLDKNIHVFQVSSKTYEGMHLTKECTLLKRGQGSEKVKARTTICKENIKEPVPHDLPVIQTYVPPMKFLGSPSRTHETVCMMGIPEEIHKMKAQEDEGNTNDGWDITVKNVDRFRQILTPTIHTLPNLEPMVKSYVTRGPVHDKEKVVREKEQGYDIPPQDYVMQHLTPQTVHIIPPDDNYIALATNPILNKHLNEFGEEFANNTRVSKKIDSNPVNDLKELLKTCDFETFIRELLHQLSQSLHETSKAKREMKSHQQNGFNLSFPYLVANLHPHGVHCYSHPHLISSVGRNTLLLDSHSKELEFEAFSTCCHVVSSLETLTRLHLSTWATKWFKRLVAYAKWEKRLLNRRFARILLLHLSLDEKSNTQGSLLF